MRFCADLWFAIKIELLRFKTFWSAKISIFSESQMGRQNFFVPTL